MSAEELLANAADRINASAFDANALAIIDAELAARSEPKARALRIKIASLQRALRLTVAGASPVTTVSSETIAPRTAMSPRVASGLWTDLLKRNGLSRPDCRPLHGYRLSDEEHDDLRRVLQARSDLANGKGRADVAAMFVLWSAHWFQRDYRGGVMRWDDLSEALGVRFDGQAGRQLVREGLAAWHRPAVKTDSETARLWLRTLAVEGGFPAGVLAQADTWPALYLSRVVGTILASNSDDEQAAHAAAESQGHYAPRAYRQDIFYALAADLACAVVRLRREVAGDARAQGVPASAWLDAMKPGWRDKLPVRTGTAAADRLVDGLMKAEAFQLVGGGEITCERMLCRDASGVWRPALQLGLDGIAKGNIANVLGRRQERLRAYPTGVFARHTTGELAVFEPPGEDDESWRIFPSRRETRVNAVPFSVPVAVELRFERTRVVETLWPGGQAVPGDLRIFDPQAGLDRGTLMLIGTTAGGYGPDRLIVATPPDWAVSPAGASDFVDALADQIEGGQRLWDVRGGAVLRSPENDLYSIAGGQRGAGRDQLLVNGPRPSGLVSDEPTIEIFAGALAVSVSEASKVRAIRADELRWRVAGERGGWRAVPHGLGLIDVAWRQPKTGYLRDSRRVFVLPEGARLTCQSEGSSGVYRAENFSMSHLSSADADMVAQLLDDKLVARFLQRPSRRARFLLCDGRARTVRVSAAFPQRSGIARWSGECVRGRGAGVPETPLTISELTDCIAFGRGTQVLRAELFDRDGRSLSGGRSNWEFGDELPLRGVAEELSALLAPFADIDVRARLTFDGAAEYWQVRQFEATIHLQSGQLVRISDVRSDETLPLMGRSVHNLSSEVLLAESTFSERASQRAPSLAHVSSGTWLVYLRRGGEVIARPSIIHLGPAQNCASSGLAAAVTIGNRVEREAAILSCLDAVAAGDSSSETDARWLVELAAGLEGLPPASLDAFRLLPFRPAAAARLALHARNDIERSAVLALMEGLPFAWHLICYPDWARAASIEEEVIFAKLEGALGAATAQNLARQTTQAAASGLAELHPLLQWPLCAAGLTPPPNAPAQSLVEAASDHIRRHGDRVPDQAATSSLFRRGNRWSLPAEFETIFDPVHLETLDAPCAAACVVSGEAQAGSDDIRRMKTAARVDPLYFAAAFNAQLMRLAQRPARP